MGIKNEKTIVELIEDEIKQYIKTHIDLGKYSYIYVSDIISVLEYILEEKSQSTAFEELKARFLPWYALTKFVLKKQPNICLELELIEDIIENVKNYMILRRQKNQVKESNVYNIKIIIDRYSKSLNYIRDIISFYRDYIGSHTYIERKLTKSLYISLICRLYKVYANLCSNHENDQKLRKMDCYHLESALILMTCLLSTLTNIMYLLCISMVFIINILGMKDECKYKIYNEKAYLVMINFYFYLNNLINDKGGVKEDLNFIRKELCSSNSKKTDKLCGYVCLTKRYVNLYTNNALCYMDIFDKMLKAIEKDYDKKDRIIKATIELRDKLDEYINIENIKYEINSLIKSRDKDIIKPISIEHIKKSRNKTILHHGYKLITPIFNEIYSEIELYERFLDVSLDLMILNFELLKTITEILGILLNKNLLDVFASNFLDKKDEEEMEEMEEEIEYLKNGLNRLIDGGNKDTGIIKDFFMDMKDLNCDTKNKYMVSSNLLIDMILFSLAIQEKISK